MHSEGGFVANAALLLWIPLCLVMFAVKRREAIFFSMLGGMLFLPEKVNFDLPLIPPFDKQVFSALGALIGCLVFSPRRLGRARPGRGLDLVLFVLMACALFTVAGNGDPMVIRQNVRPGLDYHDGISYAIGDLMIFGLPFLVGRAAFQDASDLRSFFRVFLRFGLVYSGLMLLEVRLSPQLHTWVYGFHQHVFLQSLRWGGYRPTVFMNHGLAVGLFALMVLLAVCAQSRVAKKVLRMPRKLAVAYFSVVLVLCKSTGAILFGVLGLPFVLWRSARAQVRLALVLGAICFLYPILKLTGAFPDRTVIELSKEATNEERAESLEFRFMNEQKLMDHTRERFWFGWGGFGRAGVTNAAGQDISTFDGFWIIQLASRGVIVLFLSFIILLYPVLVASRSLRAVPDKKDQLLLATLALMVALHSVDLLPNGLFTNIPFFYAGGLLQVSRSLANAARQPPSTSARSCSTVSQAGKRKRGLSTGVTLTFIAPSWLSNDRQERARSSSSRWNSKEISGTWRVSPLKTSVSKPSTSTLMYLGTPKAWMMPSRVVSSISTDSTAP